MKIKKIMDKLDDYFDMSIKKQNKKHDKLVTIINNLEQKKSELKAKMIKQSENDETSEIFNDMQEELKVVSKLLKKAKKHNTTEKDI